MKISNELKVGLTIIAATLVFILGVRFFEDLPLFSSTFSLAAEFDDARGLISGNLVRVNGVTVGSVQEVSISAVTGKVDILFHVHRSIPVTQGSYAVVAGFGALGAVRLDLYLGDPDGIRIPEGGLVDARLGNDLIGELSARAPDIMDKVDSVLSGLDSVLSEADQLLSDPGSDLRKTLFSVEGSVAELEALLTSERERIGRILENVERTTASLNSISGEDGEVISDLVDKLNGVLSTLDEELGGLGEVSDNLNLLLQKLNDRQGTLGLLINDPSMYYKMESTLESINQLLADFQADPGKYLGEMKLIDLF